MPFSTISTISISVKSSNFTLVHFNMASNANPGVETKGDGLIDILLNIKIWSFQKHHLIVQHQSVHANHDIHPCLLL